MMRFAIPLTIGTAFLALLCWKMRPKKIKYRFFIDIDGTLNEWNFNLPYYEKIYEEGYFLNRPPQKTILAAAKMLNRMYEESVFILSAVLLDSNYALFEKHQWLDKWINIPCRRRIFSICGEDKIGAVPAFNAETDILIDDYGENCRVWAEAGGRYIKVSVNAADAEHERKMHKYVIHPEMSVSEILGVIKEVANES